MNCRIFMVIHCYNSQDYGSEQVGDNEVAFADSPSVINVLDSVLGTIENNLVYDF